MIESIRRIFLHSRRQRQSCWLKEEEKPIWQRSFWDRQMWSDHTCDVKWLYVRNNPVRHGLVKHPDDWPFQGVMHG